MDLRNVKRVICWKVPKTFCSLIQKYGRCVRDITELGEAIIYISESWMRKHLNLVADPILTDEAPIGEEDAIQANATENIRAETVTTASKKKSKKSKFHGALAARDAEFLDRFILTPACRRIPWNDFFQNQTKGNQMFNTYLSVPPLTMLHRYTTNAYSSCRRSLL